MKRSNLIDIGKGTEPPKETKITSGTSEGWQEKGKWGVMGEAAWARGFGRQDEEFGELPWTVGFGRERNAGG